VPRNITVAQLIEMMKVRVCVLGCGRVQGEGEGQEGREGGWEEGREEGREEG